MRLAIFFVLILSILSNVFFENQLFAQPSLKLNRALEHRFERPIDLTVSTQLKRGRGTRGLDGALIAEQGGRIYRVVDGQVHLLTDLGDRISQNHNEEGLLGLVALKGAQAPRLLVYYSVAEPRRTVLAELGLMASDTPVGFKVASHTILLEISQPYGNHNGGGLALASDQTLFVGIGDGGAAGDPHHKAQDLSSYLGKILRLDVSRPGVISVPKDNPFTKRSGARAEIWAYGLRNPWRISVDPKTGALWVADVGQDRLEEVNLVHKGDNLGWKWREGDQDYQDRHALKGPIPTFIRASLVDPVVTYSHEQGRSITGGHVDRSSKKSSLFGHYVYADFVSGRVWSIDTTKAYRKEKDKVSAQLIAHVEQNIASFARDHEGSLYILCFDGGIYQLSTP